ncbi:C-type lectin domain family 14 member A [Eleginops maclovinus]|uniref:C-type lectin domain family 14 member A n=1 Tax=Eleginops maclovinus TaxID=56733 RepID=UPI0030803655
MKMKRIWFWFCWVLAPSIWASPPLYSLHPSPTMFSLAEASCHPGRLASLSSDQEVSAVLDLVSGSNHSTFWVGLRKVKDACVDLDLPLRGFSWTGGGSWAPQVVRWAQEPQETCTNLRCAAIRLDLTNTTGTSWGLIPFSCKTEHPSICKGWGIGNPAPEPVPGTGSEPEPEKRPEHNPELETGPEREPEKIPEPDLKPDSGPQPALKPDSGPEPDLKPDSGPEPDPCPRPLDPGTRSLSVKNSTSVLVECWSGLQLDLVCSGRPPAWRLTDGSMANLSAACQPCESGFIRNGSGNCEDIDECNGGAGPCRTSCLNKVGSYRCFCVDDAGEHHAEDSPVCAPTLGFLLPLLVAVAALVVLVLVVVVIVVLCMRRKRAMKNKEGYEPANEKDAS